MRDGEEKRSHLRRRVSTKASAARRSGTAAAVAQGLIFGVGGSAIAPKATATRAELAAVLHRFCEAFA